MLVTKQVGSDVIAPQMGSGFGRARPSFIITLPGPVLPRSQSEAGQYRYRNRPGAGRAAPGPGGLLPPPPPRTLRCLRGPSPAAGRAPSAAACRSVGRSLSQQLRSHFPPLPAADVRFRSVGLWFGHAASGPLSSVNFQNKNRPSSL